MASVCGECQSPHHEACWDRELGCSKEGCFNAPLVRLDAAVKPAAPQGAATGLAIHGVASGYITSSPSFASDDVAPAAREPARRARRKTSDVKACTECNEPMPIHDEICGECNAINTPDGLYHGPKTTSRGARDAFILSLVGLFFCGPILGPMAISRGNAAKEAIKKDPRLGGEGLATAAVIIGAVDLVFWLFALVSRGMSK
jgi:hypothetical protein